MINRVSFSGPISLCAYTNNLDDFVNSWNLSHALQSRDNIAVHVIIKQHWETYYPVNVARNVALNQSITDYVFLTDGDLVPSKNLTKNIKHLLPKQKTKQVSE